MIQKTVAYKTSQGVFASIEQAQRAELEAILEIPTAIPGEPRQCDGTVILDYLLTHKSEIVDILTMTPTSKPKARAINGGKKTRKRKPDPAAVNAALQDMDQ